MTPSRVAITGLGAVTPVGNDAASTWASLVAGRSGVVIAAGSLYLVADLLSAARAQRASIL